MPFKSPSKPFTVSPDDAYFIIANFGCREEDSAAKKGKKEIVPDYERFKYLPNYMAGFNYNPATFSMKLPLGKIAWTALKDPATEGGLSQKGSIGAGWAIEAMKQQMNVVVDKNKKTNQFDANDDYKKTVKIGKLMVENLAEKAFAMVDNNSKKTKKVTAFTDIPAKMVEFWLSKEMPKMVPDKMPEPQSQKAMKVELV